ncbi:hypothetical protein [Rhodoglobus sp.]
MSNYDNSHQSDKFYAEHVERHIAKVKKTETRKRNRKMTCTDAMIFTALHGVGSPLQRLADTYLSSWTNPSGGGAVVVGPDRIAASLGIAVTDVPTVAASLAHHGYFPSQISAANMPMRDETRAAIVEFANNEGFRLDWRTNNAPVRHAVRYAPVTGNPTATFALVVLAANQNHKFATTTHFTAEEFANTVGISESEVAALLPLISEHGWTLTVTPYGMEFRPTPALMATWGKFQADACQAITESYIDSNGVTKWHQTVSAGNRESAYEAAWRQANCLPDITDGRENQPVTELDSLPKPGGWNIYELSDAETGKHYIGITERPVRVRLREHIQRKNANLKGGEHNDAMNSWLQELSRAGREPIARLLSQTEPMTRHRTEQEEHRLVVLAVAHFGAAVLNIQHNPLESNYAFQCSGHM